MTLLRLHCLGPLCALLLTIFMSDKACAEIEITGSYSNSTSSFFLQSYQTQGGSIALSLSLGTFVGIRLFHRQEFRYTEGHDQNAENTSQYKYFQSEDHIITNAIDLKFILYPGEIFVPFITAGYGLKTFKTVKTSSSSYATIGLLEDVPQETEKTNDTIPSPVGGIGLAIRLNRDFSLNLAHNLSLGYATEPEGETSTVLDSYNTVGITYHL